MEEVDYPVPRTKGLERRGKGKPLECTAQIFADLEATSMHMGRGAGVGGERGGAYLSVKRGWLGTLKSIQTRMDSNCFLKKNNHGCSGVHRSRKGNLAHPAVQSWK